MSIFKNNLTISVFGESHGPYIGITIHNFPANIKLDLDKIKSDLALRNQFTIGKSKRTEEEDFKIISGSYQEVTTGAPLTFIIPNHDVNSQPYLDNYGLARPSHADYTAYLKYQGVNDFRGGGHLSGRLTALYMILGSICEVELNKQGINVYTRIKSLYNILDDSIVTDFNKLDPIFPVNDETKKSQMISLLQSLSDDSVGGIVETCVKGVKAGIGDPIFDNVESIISHLIFAIPGVKGIEFGSGFNITHLKGSEANDEMEYQDNKVKFLSNHSGGIQGGITNGEDIIFKTAIKPTASIAKPLKTINFINHQNSELKTLGRHDHSIVPKACQVINALTKYAIYDLILGSKNEQLS